MPWWPPTTASASPRSTCRSAGRASSSAPVSQACRSSAWPTSSRTRRSSRTPGARPRRSWLPTVISACPSTVVSAPPSCRAGAASSTWHPWEDPVRSIAGAFKGRRLASPRGPLTRPTADQVRIALMDILTPRLAGGRMLDLFAGAGAVGLEALSRGVQHVTFVERDGKAFAALEANVTALAVGASTRRLRLDVDRALTRLVGEGACFEIAFLDPPYESDLVTETLERLGPGHALAPGALVVAQQFTKRVPPPQVGVLSAFRTRRFGETTLTFFRAGG